LTPPAVCHASLLVAPLGSGVTEGPVNPLRMGQRSNPLQELNFPPPTRLPVLPHTPRTPNRAHSHSPNTHMHTHTHTRTHSFLSFSYTHSHTHTHTHTHTQHKIPSHSLSLLH